jgi:uncharacterized protein YuzB (UPF0349 family)
MEVMALGSSGTISKHLRCKFDDHTSRIFISSFFLALFSLFSIYTFEQMEARQKNKQKYLDTLKLKADLNLKRAEANSEYYENQRLNIVPPPSQKRTAAEDLEDTVAQREKAFNHLKSIMKPKDASDALAWLEVQSNVEIFLFNRFWAKFYEKIKGQTDLTPVAFQNLWYRFKDYLNKTGYTGIPIGAESGEYDQPLDVITDKIDEVLESGTETRRLYDLEHLSVLDLNAQMFEVLEQKDAPRMKFFRISKVKKVNGKSEIGDIIAFLNIDDGDKVGYVFEKEYGHPPRKTPKFVGYDDLYRKDGKIRAGFEWDGYEYPATDIFDVPGAYVGRGLLMRKKAGSLSGAYGKFGRYIISMNDLNKSILNIKYPSKSALKYFKKQKISPKLKSLVYKLVLSQENGDGIDVEEYNALSDADKKLLDKVIKLGQLDHDENLKLLQIEKLTDKEIDADVKRFDLLRGEIIAGNDNPEMIKELKLLTIKLMNNGMIPKQEANELLYLICSL